MRKIILTIFLILQFFSISAQNYDIRYYIDYLFYLTNLDKKDEGVKIGFFSKKGKMINNPEYSDGLKSINNIVNVVKGNVSGYIDKSNKLILFPQFRKAFWNGKIGIAINDEDLLALIRMDGGFITGFDFKVLQQTSENYFFVSNGDANNYINVKGEKIFNDKIDVTYNGIFNNVTAYQGENNMFGLMNIKGLKITEPIYQRLLGGSLYQNWLVKKDSKYGVIDSDGDIVVPIVYDGVSHLVKKDEPIPVCMSSKYGYLLKGKVYIPFIYDDALPFKKGIARVKKDGKYHFINKKNRIICSFNHDGGWNGEDYFSCKLAIIKINNKYGFINRKGKVIIRPIYDDVGNFNNGIARVEINGLYGFINKKGENIIPVKYKFLSEISDGKILFGINKN